jgi:hypothetical protein
MQGDHKGFLTLNQYLTGLGHSPLQSLIFVGATFMVALARTLNGTFSISSIGLG